MTHQPSLFPLPDSRRPALAADLPDGLLYRAALIDEREEAALAAAIAALPLEPFQFRGYEANRRVASFGWRYDFSRHVLEPAAPMPDFLLPLRAKVADLLGRRPDGFEQALVTEYAPGAGIGWHRDRPQFDVVAGVSLLSACPLRFRRREGGGYKRATLWPAPRSAYGLTGAARDLWEHAIAPVEALRYSVTFRSLR